MVGICAKSVILTDARKAKLEKLMLRLEEPWMDWVPGPRWGTAPIQLTHHSYPTGGSTVQTLSPTV
jgi:hypothetical protein